ncbi:hypothetical protein CEXT_208431 [Caerostris extrusa]|uniref:Secreted protein n=1 Tax=Caerostris extrusa TaxID=172846 RepID=A0AAV4N2L8_CAEEX|nr:hypothetical protein CEXT_208431 [Caerostris extrusa]
MVAAQLTEFHLSFSLSLSLTLFRFRNLAALHSPNHMHQLESRGGRERKLFTHRAPITKITHFTQLAFTISFQHPMYGPAFINALSDAFLAT